MFYKILRNPFKKIIAIFCVSILFSSCIGFKISDTSAERANSRISSTRRSQQYAQAHPDKIQTNKNKYKVVVYIHQEFETYELKNVEIGEGTIKGDLFKTDEAHLSTNGLKGIKKQGYLYEHIGEYHYYINSNIDLASKLNQSVVFNKTDFGNVQLVTKKATLINKPGLKTGIAIAGVLIIAGTVTALFIGFANLIS